MADDKSQGSGMDRSQYYDLFKEIQNEIKDKCITRFLYTIEQQAKELQQVKKENCSSRKSQKILYRSR